MTARVELVLGFLQPDYPSPNPKTEEPSEPRRGSLPFKVALVRVLFFGAPKGC